MESTDLESHTTLTSEIVAVLYLIFLILSVIMLVNILVALLTSTYEKYRVKNHFFWLKLNLKLAVNMYKSVFNGWWGKYTLHVDLITVF